MENIFTLGYFIKILLGVVLYYSIKKLVKLFWIHKINVEKESELLQFVFENHSILDFHESVDIFSSTKNKINITNNIYHIMISYDKVLHIYNYMVEDIHFNSDEKKAKMTEMEYQIIKTAITSLDLDKYRQ